MASLRSRAAELAMDIEAFFHGYEHSRQIFDALAQAIQGLQPTTITVSKSQVAFRRRRPYAWAWIPGKYLRGEHAPLVLTLALRRRDPSPRWKEVVEPRPGRFTHHLELHSPGDLDGEVLDWMHEAWSEAG